VSELASAPARGTRPPLLDRRLCFVLGKGGVGKSTVSAALGLVGARRGKRTLVIEVAGQDRLSALFAESHVGRERESPLAPGLFGVSIDVDRATEEYLADQIRMRAVVEILARSRAFHAFAAAAPGLRELVTVGKIWTLATELHPGTERPVWDLIVVDCPATGHGLAMLETAGNVREMAGSGPIKDRAARIQEVVTHPAATGVAVVARPEELAVSEAVETVAALHERGLPVAACVLNGVAAHRFGADDEAVLAAAGRSAATAGDRPVAAAIAAALAHRERQMAEEALAARLVAEVDVPVAELPLLARRRVDLPAIGALADAMAAAPEPVLC
jgi:anion-transporting  ArsA/GET3 family ATPase